MENKDKITHLTNLQAHPGWKIIQEELDFDIKLTESKLFGETRLDESETIDSLQRERVDRLELRNLPENLIKEISEENEKPDLEVYDD